jgi:rhodanese-related sulfurtransferase
MLFQLQNLLSVDKYTYESSWELDQQQCIERLGINVRDLKKPSTSTDLIKNDASSSKYGKTSIVDLRSVDDFEACHVQGSVNLPLHSLTSSSPSPFADARVLEQQWRELNGKLLEIDGEADQLALLRDRNKILVICYTGNTARIATSILRARKAEAFSLKGGF